MDDINKKKAPKRYVIDIARSGEWGNVVYRHKLSCGHIETRKRIAPTSQIACTFCVIADEKDAELRALVIRQPVSETLIDVSDLIDFANQDMSAEQDAMRLRGSIAGSLGINTDSVDVVLEDVDGVLSVAYVHVFLSAADAVRIAEENRPTIIDI